MAETFNNPKVLARTWYVLARSGDLARGEAVTAELMDRKIALWRGEDGRVRAVDARCPHLGADLGQGAVVGNDLRCSFHHWRYDETGQCTHIPMMGAIPGFARTFAYPVEERYGAVFVFNGPELTFPLPEFGADTLRGRTMDDLAVLHLPPQVLGSHPHVVACNGLDVQHWTALHELEFAETPKHTEPDPYRLRVELKFRLRGRNRFERVLRRIAGERIDGVFTTWGGNMALVEGYAGAFPLLVIFTHKPLVDGRSYSRTFIFFPRAEGLAGELGWHWRHIPGTAMVMAYLLRRDRELLDGLDFQPRLVEPDAPLKALIAQVDRLGSFDSRRPDAA